MDANYFSAILDFFTEYGEDIVITGLPRAVEERIEEKIHLQFVNGELKLPLSKAPVLFDISSPHFKHKKQVDIMIDMLETPKKISPINNGYMAALFDIESRMYCNFRKESMLHRISFKEREGVWEQYLMKSPESTGGLKLEAQNVIVDLLDNFIPFLVWRKKEAELFRKAVAEKTKEAVKLLDGYTNKNIRVIY